jgi:16S rRNA (guanine527-N7)-methyltransferase
MPRRRPEAKPAAVEDGEIADRRHALQLVPVSRETEAKLALYVDRLKRWQGIKNLVGPSTLAHVWTRHIADSAQLLALAPTAKRWVDFGSGAGFPGLVVAILLADIAGARVDLIESNNRKCAFLREVAREAGAPAFVHAGRIDEIVSILPSGVEVVTSRALAPLAELIDLAEPLLTAGATGLFLGGEAASGEATQGPAEGTPTWDVAPLASKTHPAGRIVMVRRRGSWDSHG